MGISVRRYLFPEEGEPKRISQRVADGLVFGSDAIPDYAETRQRILTVFLENEVGRPLSIYKAEGSVWVFTKMKRSRRGCWTLLGRS